MLKLKLQYFGHLMQRMDILEKTLILGKIEGMDLGMLTQHTAKSVYWHWIVVNESTAFIANVKQGEWAVSTQKIWNPNGFLGKAF